MHKRDIIQKDKKIKVRKIIVRLFMIPATFMYMRGIVSRNDLYRFRKHRTRVKKKT